MITVLIIILLAVLVLLIASLAVGRSTHKVESARDTEYLELEGDWIRYNVIGGGPPVVLVHGWLSSSKVWDQLAQRLSQRFTVYTLDLPGFGESDKPIDGYGVRYGGRLLYAFCAHFGLTRVSVIGHDLGGDMAMKLASDHPDVVGRVVLVATPANEEQIDLPTSLWAATLPVVGPLFYALGRSVRPVRNSWMRAFVSEQSDVTEEMLDDAASSTPAAMGKTLSVSKREISGGRVARQSRMVRVPVLIVTGEEDQIVDPQAAGVWSKSLEQSEVCLMDECGHMPMIERTGEFNAQILAFLTGDSRYLEYADQSQPKSQEIDMDEDTIEVGTLPPEGEDPAFDKGLFSPGSRRSRGDDEDEIGEINFRNRPRRRQRGTEDERYDDREDTSRFGREEDEIGPAGTPLAANDPITPEGDGDASTDAERGGENDDDRPWVVRRFGGRSSRPSARRHGRPWDFDEVDEEVPENESQRDTGASDLPNRRRDEHPAENDLQDDTNRTDTNWTTGADDDPASPEAEPRGDLPVGPRENDEPSAGPPSFDEEPASRERPSGEPEKPHVRRIIRRGDKQDGGDGSVPEVPDGLFDWGSSLDGFEPVDRNRMRRREREQGDEEGDFPPDRPEG